MKEKFDNFCKALERLKEALQAEPTGLNLDAAIQRFEFTYELVWKVLKLFLLKAGIECYTPRDCFRSAFQAGYIKDEEVWLDMIKDRNFTTHVYDENQARKIYERIKNQYLRQLELLKSELEWKL